MEEAVTQTPEQAPGVELKPCPFCGSHNVTYGARPSHYVMCDDCGAEGAWFDGDGPSWSSAEVAMMKAIAAWNTRASLPDPRIAGQPWQPRIGEEVRVTPEFVKRWPDWEDVPLWVAGISASKSRDGLNVTLTDEWPLRSRSELTDGFYIGCAHSPDDIATYKEGETGNG